MRGRHPGLGSNSVLKSLKILKSEHFKLYSHTYSKKLLRELKNNPYVIDKLIMPKVGRHTVKKNFPTLSQS